MSRPHALDQARRVADSVGEALEGQRLISHFEARLRTEFLDPDDLYCVLDSARQASPDRLRGAARRLQKLLEREIAHATE